jgi:hypothetical protein
MPWGCGRGVWCCTYLTCTRAQAAKDNVKLRSFFDAVSKSRGRMARLGLEMNALTKEVGEVRPLPPPPTGRRAQQRCVTPSRHCRPTQVLAAAAATRNETEWALERKGVLSGQLDDAVRRLERRREMGLALPDVAAADRNGTAVTVAAVRGLGEKSVVRMEADVAAATALLTCLQDVALAMAQDASAAALPPGTKRKTEADCRPSQPSVNGTATTGAGAGADAPRPPPPSDAAGGGTAAADKAVRSQRGVSGGVGEGSVVWLDPHTGRLVDEGWPGDKVKGRVVEVVNA